MVGNDGAYTQLSISVGAQLSRALAPNAGCLVPDGQEIGVTVRSGQ